jgi:hypothetical protein
MLHDLQGLLDLDVAHTRRHALIHERYKAPYKYVPLNAYRKVMVTDRMENGGVPGPAHEGAALIMGNSVDTWHRHYWYRKRQHLARQAALDVQAYRAAVLAQEDPQESGGSDGEDEEEPPDDGPCLAAGEVEWLGGEEEAYGEGGVVEEEEEEAEEEGDEGEEEWDWDDDEHEESEGSALGGEDDEAEWVE